MDLVAEYVNKLGLAENAACGLAGQLLGLIEDTVRERVSFGVAARLRNGVPEMAQWQLAAPTLRPGTLSINDLAGTSMLDPGAELEALLARFRVPRAQSALATSLALDFLATRVEPSAFEAIARAVRELSA